MVTVTVSVVGLRLVGSVMVLYGCRHDGSDGSGVPRTIGTGTGTTVRVRSRVWSDVRLVRFRLTVCQLGCGLMLRQVSTVTVYG